MTPASGSFAAWGDMEPIVVGVAGEICSGKDFLGEFLDSSYGFAHVSLTDLVSEGREMSGLEETRVNQRKYADAMRRQSTGDYFVVKALERAVGNHLIVLTGIYCIAEARAILRQSNGVLVGVECADATERFRRLQSRFDGFKDALTEEEFVDNGRNESFGADESTPNVRAVLDMAHLVVRNDSGLEEFELAIDRMMAMLLPGVKKLPERRPLTVALHTGISRLIGEIRELQIRHRALEFVTSRHILKDLDPVERALSPLIQPMHAAHQVSNQFGQKIIVAYLNPDAEVALAEFRRIEARTLDEEMVSLVNDSQFRAMHSDLHEHLAENAASLHGEIVALLRAHQEGDKAQFNPVVKRNLETVRLQGVEAYLPPEHRDALRSAQLSAGDGQIPVTELIKNERVLNVSNFSGSKISLAIHDFMDHLWLFDLLERSGLLSVHRELLDSVGDPHLFDIFKREGEMVASIGFGVRLWGAQQVGFVPNHGIDDIHAAMATHFDSGHLTSESSLDTYRHLRDLRRRPTSRESQSLAFVFSNYLVELDEQRRKHGRIWRRERSTKKKTGELDPWGAEFLSFFIDVHRELASSHNKHRDNLLRTHILVEQFLASEQALDGRPLTLKLEHLGAEEFSNIRIPPDRISWMSRNYGFSAVRENVI